MRTFWLRLLAFMGNRRARKTLNRSAGARRAAVTRKANRIKRAPPSESLSDPRD
jgi:hypothetical protein